MQKKVSLILIVIVFAAILIYSNSRGYLNGAKNTAEVATTPISLFFSQFSGRTSGFFSGLFRLGSLQKENAEVKDQVNKLQAELAQLSEDKKENERLKSLLGFTTTHVFTYEPAEVISFDPSNVRGVVVVNRGKKNGIEPGMAVISDGFLAGRISEAGETTSKVQLITDPASAIPATLQNINTGGIAKGQIGFGLVMEKIPQGESIEKGNVVISSGLGGEMPKGLILGVVEGVERKENSLFASANVRPSAELGKLSRVIIIRGQ